MWRKTVSVDKIRRNSNRREKQEKYATKLFSKRLQRFFNRVWKSRVFRFFWFFSDGFWIFPEPPYPVNFVTVLNYCFYTSSAQAAKLLCEEQQGVSANTVKYVGYCSYHWNKKVSSWHNVLDLYRRLSLLHKVREEVALEAKMFCCWRFS